MGRPKWFQTKGFAFPIVYVVHVFIIELNHNIPPGPGAAPDRQESPHADEAMDVPDDDVTTRGRAKKGKGSPGGYRRRWGYSLTIIIKYIKRRRQGRSVEFLVRAKV